MLEDIQVHGILKGGSPIFLLGNTVLVSFGEGRVVIELWESKEAFSNKN